MAYIFWHSILAFYLTFYSDILSWHYIILCIFDIYSDILFGILSGIYSDILCEMALQDINREHQISVGARLRSSSAWDLQLAVPHKI